MKLWDGAEGSAQHWGYMNFNFIIMILQLKFMVHPFKMYFSHYYYQNY